MAEGPDLKELTIVLVGKTGSGKSASGNTILGERNAFLVGSDSVSVTSECNKKSGEVDGTLVHVIDSPGLFDTRLSNIDLKSKIADCITMSVPGPHAFLLVIRLGVRFTTEEQDAVKWIEENFGNHASMYSIVLFTCKDLRSPDKAKKESKELGMIINNCGGRYHSFNNLDEHDRDQVTKLIAMIKTMVENNGGKHYTNEMYEAAQQKLREQAEQRIREEEEEEERKRHRWREEDREKDNQESVRRLRCFAGALAAFGSVLIGIGIGIAALLSALAESVGTPLILVGLLCFIVAICMCTGVPVPGCCKSKMATVTAMSMASNSKV